MDVENLFRQDNCPFTEGNEVFYDVNPSAAGTQRVHVPLDYALSATCDLRAKLVQLIQDAARDVPELEPFTILRAHEAIANRDLKFDSVLVNTRFVPLLDRVRHRILGIKLKVFAHDEVPPGDVYGFAEPEYVGAVARSPVGQVGLAITNAEAIVWGRFPLRGTR